MIETGQLQSLVAVSKAKSFSKAAEDLGVTQSAISQSIKNLENKVGSTLIVRKGKSLTLTTQGEILTRVGKDFMKKLDLTMAQIHDDRQKMMGKITVGTLIGIGKSWLCSRMIDFAAKYEDLDVSVTLDFPDNLATSFEKRDIDYLILPEYHVPHYAQREELHHEYCTLVYPKEWNISEDTSLKEIMQYPIILFEEKDPLFFRWCREKFGFTPKNLRARVVVNSFGHMLGAVHRGLGIAVIPTHVFKRSYFKDKVGTLGQNFQFNNDKFYFAHHNEDSDTLKTKTLYSFLRQEFESHGPLQ